MKILTYERASARPSQTLILALALVATGFGLACNRSSAKSQQAAPPQAFPVKVQVIQSVPVNDATEYVATLKSRDSAVIMPEVEGRITKILVRSGDRVSSGATLMEIDPEKQQATLSSQQNALVAQRANVVYAQQQFERSQQLSAQGVIAKQELDQARSSVDSAKAQLLSLEAQVQQQQVQLRYYRVISTFAGVIGDIPVRVGDRVTTATMLTTVDKPGSLEVYIYVPVERSGQLRMKLPVQLVNGAGDVLGDSRITFISPQVDNTTQTVLAKATIVNHDDRLRTAQFIRARVIWGSHDGPVVPILSVSRIGGQFFAFLAENDNGKMVAHQKPLKVGDTLGNDYVVLDGVKAGDKLIVSGTQFLIDGMPVAPQG